MKNTKKILGFILIILVYFIYTNYGDELGLVEVENKVNERVDNVIKLEPVGDLRIHYLDVGQADATLIENNGKYMLIDAGNNEDGKLLVNYFKNLGIESFEYVVATHVHEDHIGGMDDILNNFKINNFYMPDVVTTTATFEDVVIAMEDNNLVYDTPKIGSGFGFEGCNFTVLSVSDDDSDLNDTSIVLKLVYGTNKFLFMGDATEKIEGNILNLGVDLKTDVYKVAHHGSDYSNSISFLNKVRPEYSIISSGEGNSYGHPHSKVLNNLKKLNSTIYRTDKDGTILVESDGKNIDISFLDTNVDG